MYGIQRNRWSEETGLIYKKNSKDKLRKLGPDSQKKSYDELRKKRGIKCDLGKS